MNNVPWFQSGCSTNFCSILGCTLATDNGEQLTAEGRTLTPPQSLFVWSGSCEEAQRTADETIRSLQFLHNRQMAARLSTDSVSAKRTSHVCGSMP